MSTNKPIPKDYESASAQLGKRATLIVANNTILARHGATIGMVYHSTEVVTYHEDGRITLTSGGWRTVTTKERLNWVLHQHGLSLYQEASRWFVAYHVDWATAFPFADGFTVKHGVIVLSTVGQSTSKVDKQQKARLQRFAKLCADSLPLDLPSGGDCWFCRFTVQPATVDKPQTLGEAMGDTSHLQSHIDEGYVVPSLVYNALHESNAGPAYYWGAFDTAQDTPDGRIASKMGGNWTTIARCQVKRSVYRYLLRRFGYAV